MTVVHALYGVAALLILAPAAVLFRSLPRISDAIYSSVLVVAAALCAFGFTGLLVAAEPSTVVLPLGLPWLGAHFRVDALSLFFVVVINLGGVTASLFALGYGRHENEPRRVLPFYPAYLAGMNLVLLAGDAFSCLVSWEFMSLSPERCARAMFI